MSDDDRADWVRDEGVLAEVGALVFQQTTDVEIRLPRRLADAAVAAWERSYDEPAANPESLQERTTRHRAGSLALLGLALSERGWETGAEVVVRVDAWVLGDALHAADDAGLISLE